MCAAAPEPLSLILDAHGLRLRFSAMASPCEVLFDCSDAELCLPLARVVVDETWRIQNKYNRYDAKSVVSRINTSCGAVIALDQETNALISYADECYRLSEGLFDITSGVLRRIWKFDGSDNIPSDQDINNIKDFIGWQKVVWRKSEIRLPPGMEIDLGGLGKEYAVDSVHAKLIELKAPPFLINFGGDLRVSGPRTDRSSWRVAIEAAHEPGRSEGLVELRRGALTTSGDARRFLVKDGKRYSHILDPRTGRPVVNPPRSVTVAADTCLEAGLLSTLAMLQGERAEYFLDHENLTAWWIR